MTEVLSYEQILDLLRQRWPGEEQRILALIGAQALQLRTDLATDGGDLIGVDPPPGYTSDTLNALLAEIGASIPLLNGVNTWSGQQTVTGDIRSLGTSRIHEFSSDDGANRYRLLANISNTADSGFRIDRWDGTAYVQRFQVTQNSINISSPSAANSILSLGGSAGFDRAVEIRTGTSARWRVYADAVAETGSNAGSNFAIAAFSDANAFIANRLTINRATGAVSIPGATTVGSLTIGSNATSAVQAGTTTGRYARWNNTAGRWEEFDLLGTANTWTGGQVFGGAAGSEGGEIGLQSPVTGTNLTGNVSVDIQGNSFRVFGLFAGQIRGLLFDFAGTQDGIHTVWHTGNQAHVQAGTATGQFARWNQTTSRWEEFDLLGSANSWGAFQTFLEIRLDAAAGFVRPIEWRTGGLQRWRIVASGDPETGGGAGTNLNFTRFDDAGNNLGAAARIVRNTGVFEFNSGINVAGGSIIYGGITQAVVQTGTATGQFARWNQTTGRYEPVTLNTLPDAADDAAAAGAGVAVGGLYRTGSTLKARIA